MHERLFCTEREWYTCWKPLYFASSVSIWDSGGRRHGFHQRVMLGRPSRGLQEGKKPGHRFCVECPETIRQSVDYKWHAEGKAKRHENSTQHALREYQSVPHPRTETDFVGSTFFTFFKTILFESEKSSLSWSIRTAYDMPHGRSNRFFDIQNQGNIIFLFSQMTCLHEAKPFENVIVHCYPWGIRNVSLSSRHVVPVMFE